MNRLWLPIIGVMLATACVRPAETETQNLELPAADLIRRNVFRLSDAFTIDSPIAFQYGNVQVDGPTGGMLYRFVTTPGALDWLVEEWSLDRMGIESPDEIPLDFLPPTPEWWMPDTSMADAYYSASTELVPRGHRTLVIIFDEANGILYVAEHYGDMMGI